MNDFTHNKVLGIEVAWDVLSQGRLEFGLSGVEWNFGRNNAMSAVWGKESCRPKAIL